MFIFYLSIVHAHVPAPARKLKGDTASNKATLPPPAYSRHKDRPYDNLYIFYNLLKTMSIFLQKTRKMVIYASICIFIEWHFKNSYI